MITCVSAFRECVEGCDLQMKPKSEKLSEYIYRIKASEYFVGDKYTAQTLQ